MNNPLYRRRDLYDNWYAEIGDQLEVPGANARQQWEYLKKRFTTRVSGSGSNFPHSEDMSFLDGVVARRKPKTSTKGRTSINEALRACIKSIPYPNSSKS